MRTLLVLTCCLALATALGAENQHNNKTNKEDKQEQTKAARPAGAARSHNRNSLGTEMKVSENINNSSQNQSQQKRYTPNNLRTKSVDATNPNAPRGKAKSTEGQPKVSKLGVKEKESDDSTTEKLSLRSKVSQPEVKQESATQRELPAGHRR